MTPAIAAGLIGAGGSALAGAGNIASTILTNQANRQLAQYSYEQQKQMIAEQNEYNSPSAQMARYQEAGLNPNLIYGNISSGNQSQIAKYQAPTMQAPKIDMQSATSMASNILGLKQQLENIKKTENENSLFENARRSSWFNSEFARSKSLQEQMNTMYLAKLLGVPYQYDDGMNTIYHINDYGNTHFFNPDGVKVQMYNAELANKLQQKSFNDSIINLRNSTTKLNEFRNKNILPWEARLKNQQYLESKSRTERHNLENAWIDDMKKMGIAMPLINATINLLKTLK